MGRCSKEARQRWLEAHPDYYKEYVKRDPERQREYNRIKQRMWYARNREHCLQLRANFLAAHPGYAQAYREANRERINELARARYKKKKQKEYETRLN